MEFDLIERLQQRAIARGDVRLGIGDDAAIVAPPPGHDLVISMDTLVAGVHFAAHASTRDLGWKSLAVNLSDLAAMGATPAWALLSLTLPSADAAFVEEFSDGFCELAAQHHVALIGGDTTRGPLSISVVVHGFVPPGQALRRDGAHVGDEVYVSGTLGDAAAGLRCMDRRATLPFLAGAVDARDGLLARLHRPTPRVATGTTLRGQASACIDISDGLLADLGHIASRSGVGIDVDAIDLPASSALLDLFDATDRLALQASGGDDYELAFCLPPARVADVLRDLARIGGGATRIGRVVEGRGVRLLDAQGGEIMLARHGWEHFS